MVILSLQIRPVGIGRDRGGDKQKRIGHSGLIPRGLAGTMQAWQGIRLHVRHHQTPSLLSSMSVYVRLNLKH